MNNAAKKIEAEPWDFTMGDRLRRALKYAGMSRDDMASYLDVAPATVSTWVNDRIRPSRQTMRLWALRTGVPLEWLEYTPRDSNPEPADMRSARVTPIDSAPSISRRLTTTPEGGEAA